MTILAALAGIIGLSGFIYFLYRWLRMMSVQEDIESDLLYGRVQSAKIRLETRGHYLFESNRKKIEILIAELEYGKDA